MSHLQRAPHLHATRCALLPFDDELAAMSSVTLKGSEEDEDAAVTRTPLPPPLVEFKWSSGAAHTGFWRFHSWPNLPWVWGLHGPVFLY